MTVPSHDPTRSIKDTAARALTPGQRAALAMLWEITAPKAGNVHRGADFDDVSYPQFVAGAIAVVPALDAAAAGGPLGQAVLDAVRATRAAAGSNTNLGSILLLAPLVMVRPGESTSQGVKRVLQSLTADDARNVYAAIAAAKPGGMGRVPSHDVSGPPPGDLLEAMRLAAERDRVARQYVTGFTDLLETVVPALMDAVERLGLDLLRAIVHTQLVLLARWPDSLIARKCGERVATRASDQAAAVLASGPPGSEAYQSALAGLDFWMRSDGHQRNPGATADLIAAGLYVALSEGGMGRGGE